MYAFLLVLGGVIAAAGLTLVSSGVSIQNHTFDATNVTPGTIAITGGCILAGLGFVIRALMRVERALTVRPMPRPPRLGDSADAATSAVPSGEPGRLGVPPKPAAVAAAATEPSAAPAAFVPSSVAQTGAPERLRVAPLERLEGTSVAEVNEASLLPKVAVVPKEEADEISAAVLMRTNGSAAAQIVPRVAVSGRPARPAQPQSKSAVFDSLWPKAQRSEIHSAPAVKVPPPNPAIPVTSEQAAVGSELSVPIEEAAPLPPPPSATAVSILKSGVVEGMAYTLYSDGSIEAQLPGGTLRFDSIAELRNHIEQRR